MNLEPTMLGAFKENPTFFALAALLASGGFVLLLAALIALGKKPGVTAAAGFAAVAVGLLTFGAGAMGSWSARKRTDGALSSPGLTARDRERIGAYGYAEARMPLKFALALGAIPLLAGAALGAVGMAKARRK